jgi:hypothetical protein
MLTVRDASLVTVRNRNKALNAYATGFTSAIQTARPAQGLTVPGATGAETVSEKLLGCIACTAYSNDLKRYGLESGTPDGNTTVYPFNPSSGGAGRTY